MKQILSAYKKGTEYGINMQDNGLVAGEQENVALTWMDSSIDGCPVVQRAGMPVEVNALWYNAVCFALDLANGGNDKRFIEEWGKWPAIIAKSFVTEFWSDEREYLADCVREGIVDWTVRA